MKAITLTQPWASLVAQGVKTVETRSWQTNYRGPIAIHAAKGWTASDREFAGRLIRENVLTVPLMNRWPVPVNASDAVLPLGAMVAVARLRSIVRTEEFARYTTHADELRFGDFSAGRFAWVLDDITPFGPEPAKGALGLWEWTG